jgi:hypothetical protein
VLGAGHPQVVAASVTCAKGGVCQLGDTGPGGGIVFYVVPTVQWWGQYLEASTKPDETRGAWDQVVLHAGKDAKSQRILGKLIGAGARNTEQLVASSNIWALRQFANSWRIADVFDSIFRRKMNSTRCTTSSRLPGRHFPTHSRSE